MTNEEPEHETRSVAPLGSGLIANYAALAVVAAAGLIINLVVAGVLGPEGLGVFSQLYVAFVICAQVAVFGMHYAVLRWVSTGDAAEGVVVARRGLTSLVPVSATVAVVLFLAAPTISSWAGSPDLGPGLRYAAPGLVLHATNKVLLAYLNGRRRMTAYAGFQALRMLALTGFVIVIVSSTSDPSRLGIAFTIAELVTAVGIVVWTRELWTPIGPAAGAAPPSALALARFGGRSIGAGLIQELNARIDVLVLAFLVSDERVGTYALAATLIEGAMQLLVVLRNNVNPIIAAMIQHGRSTDLEELARRFRPWIIASASIATLLVAALYRPAVDWVGLDEGFRDAWPSLFVLTIGLGIAAPLLPFDQIFMLAGHPGRQTLVVTAAVSINTGMNIALVPLFGIAGAAVATATSLVLLAVIIWTFARSTLGVRLL